MSEKTVRRLIASAGLPAVQLGGPGAAFRIAADELQRWLFADAAAQDPAERVEPPPPGQSSSTALAGNGAPA